MAQQISWGNVSFLLNQDRFEQGYQRGRRYFFEDCSEQKQASDPITVADMLRLVAVPDEQGHYQLDDGIEATDFREGVEEMIGVLTGYLAGPLYEETSEEYQQRQAECFVVAQPPQEREDRMEGVTILPEEACSTGIAL